jgi:uncharacterized phage protein gp47/JayE
MPLSLRTKDAILTDMVAMPLAGGIVTDFKSISVIRQILEGNAAAIASLYYALYTTHQDWFRKSATDEGLDARGEDIALPRDTGQAASGAVLYTRDPTYVEDIPLAAQQAVSAMLPDGTVVSYHTLAAVTLQPQGRSVSAAAPGTALTGGSNDQVQLNLDGDGLRTVTLGTQTTGAGIASTLQTLVRALTAVNPAHQPAYAGFRSDYGTVTPGVYTLRSGTTGPTSSVVVTPAATSNASVTLKLGVAQGGSETSGMDTLDVPVLCDQVGVIGNVGAGHINTLASSIAGILSVLNPLAFTNGRAPASSDAYRQDQREYLLSLGTGIPTSIERAVYQTRGLDGQRHVLSAQVVYGVGMLQVYVCDGRSLLIGAQEDVRLAVERELLGLGPSGREWVVAGTHVGVVPATIHRVDVQARVVLGPTPNLVLAQAAIVSALYTLLYQWPVGAALTYIQLAQAIDATVAEMLGVTFTSPAEFLPTGSQTLPARVGQKLMPGILAVEVVRA